MIPDTIPTSPCLRGSQHNYSLGTVSRMGSLRTAFPPRQGMGGLQAQPAPRPQRHPGHSIPPILGRCPRHSPFSKQGPVPGTPPHPSLNKIRTISGNPQSLHPLAWSRVPGHRTPGPPPLSPGLPSCPRVAPPADNAPPPPPGPGPSGSSIQAGLGAAPQGPGAALSVCSVCGDGDGGFVCGTWGEGGKQAMGRWLGVCPVFVWLWLCMCVCARVRCGW